MKRFLDADAIQNNDDDNDEVFCFILRNTPLFDRLNLQDHINIHTLSKKLNLCITEKSNTLRDQHLQELKKPGHPPMLVIWWLDTFLLAKDGDLFQSNYQFTIQSKIQGATNITQLVESSVHGLLLDKDGNVFNKPIKDRYIPPVKRQDVSNIVQMVSCGENILLLARDGDVFRLGEARSTIVKIQDVSNIEQIVTKMGRTFLLAKDGSVYSFGGGRYGSLGHGNKNDIKIPKKIRKVSNIVQIATGMYHVVLLDKEGDVYSCGTGDAGQLGHGNNNSVNIFTKILGVPKIPKIVQIAAGVHHTVLLDQAGNVYTCGGCNQTTLINIPTQIQGVSNIVQIAASGHYTWLLDKEGNVYSCGGIDKDLTIPNPIQGISKIVQIIPGIENTLFVREDGIVYTNDYGSNREKEDPIQKQMHSFRVVRPELKAYNTIQQPVKPLLTAFESKNEMKIVDLCTYGFEKKINSTQQQQLQKDDVLMNEIETDKPKTECRIM